MCPIVTIPSTSVKCSHSASNHLVHTHNSPTHQKDPKLKEPHIFNVKAPKRWFCTSENHIIHSLFNRKSFIVLNLDSSWCDLDANVRSPSWCHHDVIVMSSSCHHHVTVVNHSSSNSPRYPAPCVAIFRSLIDGGSKQLKPNTIASIAPINKNAKWWSNGNALWCELMLQA